MSYELVRYQPEHKSQIIELQTHLWSPQLALNASYFEWKYERNPYVSSPLIYLALYRGRAVGMRGFFGVRWEAGAPSQRLTALYADDMVIVPEHRQRGLMAMIMNAAFEDLAGRPYDFAFNLSAGAVTLRSSLAMGWRSAGWMRPMRWRTVPTAVSSRLRRLLRKAPQAARNLGRVGVEQSFKSEPSFDPALVDTAVSVGDTPRTGEMAELVGRLGSARRISHVRDAEYFAWRFRNPLSRYRFVYWDEARLEGYLVLQEYTSEFGDRESVNIVDWEGSSSAVREGLLRSTLAVARGRRLSTWTATLPEATVQLLAKHGFAAEREPPEAAPPSVIVRALALDKLQAGWMLGGLPFLDLGSWDLRMLFSMLG